MSFPPPDMSRFFCAMLSLGPTRATASSGGAGANHPITAGACVAESDRVGSGRLESGRVEPDRAG